MEAIVNKIIPFSNVDGPGNRLAIFLQGCPFRCLSCHNPETIKICNDCQVCVPGCPTKALSVVDDKVVWDESLCIDCDQCIKVCPNLSSPKTKVMSVEQVFEFIKKRASFLDGITASGGECMNYPDFLLELFKKVHTLNLTCLIDTNGAYDLKNYPELVAECDGFMLDVKAVDEQFHFDFTKNNNINVLKNLEYLNSIDKLEEVRTVLLPDYDCINQETISYVVKNINPNVRYKLIAYRPYGVREEGLEILGEQSLSDDELKKYEAFAKELNHKNIKVV